jgi:hypothetical protein
MSNRFLPLLKEIQRFKGYRFGNIVLYYSWINGKIVPVLKSRHLPRILKRATIDKEWIEHSCSPKIFPKNVFLIKRRRGGLTIGSRRVPERATLPA